MTEEQEEQLWRWIVQGYQAEVAHRRWWGLTLCAFALLGMVVVQVCR
jgi:hypothetical protein